MSECIWVFKTPQRVPYVLERNYYYYPYVIASSYEQAVELLVDKYTWLDMHGERHQIMDCPLLKCFDKGTEWWKW